MELTKCKNGKIYEINSVDGDIDFVEKLSNFGIISGSKIQIDKKSLLNFVIKVNIYSSIGSISCFLRKSDAKKIFVKLND